MCLLLYLFLGVLLLLSPVCPQEDMNTEALVAGDLSILSSYRVDYSEPSVDPKVYTSRGFTYNPKSMEHLYYLTHFFIDLITKEDVLPASIQEKLPQLVKNPELLQDNWQEILLHYIGVATLAICGLLGAIIIPIVGFCFCFCRCAGKCGGYPQHFDKKSDACKRVLLGILLSALVIGAMFCVITTFVTNHYAKEGLSKLPSRLDNVTSDASAYLEATSAEINSVYVNNFNELEVVLNDIVDQSGVILKKSLAEVTQAVAIEDINSIVDSLGDVKKHLRDVKAQITFIKDHIGQLSLGLEGTKARLLQALEQCASIDSCGKFMRNYDIPSDLSVVGQFESLQSPKELESALTDIDVLLNDDIQEKVRLGQKQLDSINLSIDASLKGHKPQIKEEIRRLGQMIEEKSIEIQGALNEVNRGIDSVRRDIPSSVSFTLLNVGNVLHYIGLGMSCLVLLILICYILGLFYGFCGKRPGNEYGDECCNRGSGANWIISAVYMTFLFSFVLLILTTGQFIAGTAYEKAICQTIKSPQESDVFEYVIDYFAKPELDRKLAAQFSDHAPPLGPLSEIITQCHRNESAYSILHLESIYDIRRIKDWREEFNIAYSLSQINVRTNDLRKIQLLSPTARADLERLAESQISDMNFTAYTELVENSVTQIELPSFIRKLRQVKEELKPSLGRVGAALENEALFLDQMQRLIVSIRVSIRQLKSSIAAIQNEAKYETKKINMRTALTDLMRRTDKATQYIRSEGPQLIDSLSSRLLEETVSLIDGYAERIVNKTLFSIGKCWPVSMAYNATVLSVCSDIADPFNGFWVSIGLCLLFYLSALVFAVSLVSLYRKSEPYPGPLVEVNSDHRLYSQQQQQQQRSFTNISEPPKPSSSAHSSGGKKQTRGHRRNPSESLPEAVHYRAAYSYRFQDAAQRVYGGSSPATGGSRGPDNSSNGGPPRYTSNPNLNASASGGGEYERPPPYYYPGPEPGRN